MTGGLPFGLTPTDVLAWTVVAVFLTATGVHKYGRSRGARMATTAGFALFGTFWLAVTPVFLFDMKSFVEGLLSLMAVPLSLYAGYLVVRGHDEPIVLARALAVMGLVYLAAMTAPGVSEFLIETVAAQTDVVIRSLGYDPQLTVSDRTGALGQFTFVEDSGHRITIHIQLACTGIGSMAIFAGIVATVRAPLRRKTVALVAAIGIVWALNVARNAFIILAFGRQWFQAAPFVDLAYAVGYVDPRNASYFLADRVISQSLSVVALIGIGVLLLRVLPEILTVFEAALYVATRRRFDLRRELAAFTPEPRD